MTINSDWGEWWVREELDGSSVSGVSMWFLGVTGVAIRTPETTLYIDPYFSTERDREYVARMPPVPMEPQWADACDAVFCTHDHRDHFWPPSFGPLLEGEDASVHAPAECYENHDVSAIPEDQQEVAEPGDSYEIGDLTVHVRGGRDPDADGSVTYVLEHDAGTIFHGGDNRPCEAFDEIGAEFDIDLGTLAYGTVGRLERDGEVVRRKLYNSSDDVIEAANALEIDRLVPTHWRRWRSIQADPGALSAAAGTFEYPHVIETVEVGDRLRLGRPGVVPPTHLGGE
ncbi:MBL fold metallo-hydrolase [Halomontanus rarus]|uniref:MBL fold metallo-hydrolase n=1 Tax=Halomontanus rarus TaxID=3034020 RepID=UPI001A995F24